MVSCTERDLLQRALELTIHPEVIVSLDGTASVASCIRAPDNLHVSPDMAEMVAAEEALLAHPEFQAAIAKLQLPPNAKVVADGWIYGELEELEQTSLTTADTVLRRRQR